MNSSGNTKKHQLNACRYDENDEQNEFVTLGMKLDEEAKNYDGQILWYGQEGVLAADEFGWVFDRKEYALAMDVEFKDGDTTIGLLLEHCEDLSGSVRGIAALKRFEIDCGYGLKTE